MGTYITSADLASALSPRVLKALADDNNDGTADAGAVDLAIAHAEAEVNSYLLGYYTLPLSDPGDALVRLSAIDFAVAFLQERHPEYVRNRDAKEGEIRYARAVTRMQRIQTAKQRLPDESQTPKNVGGVICDPGPRFWLPNVDGTGGFGDF